MSDQDQEKQKRQSKYSRELNENERDSLIDQLLDYAKSNSVDNKLSLVGARNLLKKSKSVIENLYAYGPQELKQYILVNDIKSAQPAAENDPKVGKRNTITIPKHFIQKFNENNPGNELNEDDKFDVDVSEGKIVLTKK